MHSFQTTLIKLPNKYCDFGQLLFSFYFILILFYLLAQAIIQYDPGHIMVEQNTTFLWARTQNTFFNTFVLRDKCILCS